MLKQLGEEERLLYGKTWVDMIATNSSPASVETIERNAFAYCNAIDTVIFEGTVAQWQAIDKPVQWCLHNNFYVVRCSDGYVHASSGEAIAPAPRGGFFFPFWEKCVIISPEYNQ